jgi:DNA mismatch repair protein MutS2
LAAAVLEGLQARGAMTVATTHLSDLKEAAASSACMTNASLEFDTDTLTPTYRLQVGKPGRSYGLAIARRLGLAADVVERAEAILPEAIKTLDATLAELERREQVLRDREASSEDQRVALEAESVRAAELRVQLDALDADLRVRARTLEQDGRDQARKFLLESRRRVEDALALARAAVDEATAKQARRLVEDGVKEEGSAIQRLEELAQKKGWRVKGGGRGAQPEWREPSTVARQEFTDVAAASEVSIRGMRADEAEGAVLSAIDDAVVGDLAQLRIIHGKGTGVLRQVVADLVQSDPRVAHANIAPPDQGGAGVTIVEFA